MAIDERVDAFIDFDDTLIKNHTLGKILLNARKYQKDKKRVINSMKVLCYIH